GRDLHALPTRRSSDLLDDEAMETARSLGMTMVRAATVGCHPQFVSMLRKLIEERMGRRAVRDAVGQYPANHDVCPANCCLSPQRDRKSTRLNSSHVKI